MMLTAAATTLKSTFWVIISLLPGIMSFAVYVYIIKYEHVYLHT